MTKLQEWLSALGIFFAIWFYLITSKTQSSFITENYSLILYSPLICLVLFGLYAATVVIYRTLTFNDCPEAAEELQREIIEAREELTRLGFKFKEKSN
ncbi:dolichol-phosphate mannosyltransferase subunit 3 [Anoplophora glabripennis]|uniref:dolichol-phosphate mannosyltransferase subunit 3 n=1 Tax=Anoplophora glabripennis TaxID=217634 RepID=UPI0008740F94|nr:dolichol-phosphate mannosyltransferase subunit 3 [Anoplophora glabripennis]